MTRHEKEQKLKDYISSLETLAVAFSGGVDSAYLLKTAHDILGEGVTAVTARSATFPEREYLEAKEFTHAYGIRHVTADTDEIDAEGFAENPRDRCYICKKTIFSKIITIAEKHGLKHVAEGSNLDDLSDYRPGLKAIEQLGVISPLRMVGLNKQEIRELSEEMGLPTWDKPSFACLASRFPYGERITRDKLKMVGEAEQVLIDLGIRQVRVRYHGQVARIEVNEEDMAKIIAPGVKDKIYGAFDALGFKYTALDLKGYRTGSMN